MFYSATPLTSAVRSRKCIRQFHHTVNGCASSVQGMLLAVAVGSSLITTTYFLMHFY